MKYYICQLNESGISSNLSYALDLEDKRILINPWDSSSLEWGQIDYDLLESFEKDVQNIIVIWYVNDKNGISAYRIHKRIESSDYDVIFGLTPSGHIATWLRKGTKQTLLSWEKSTENRNSSEVDTCNYAKRMVQYTYRYNIVFNSWNKDELKWGSSEEKHEIISFNEYLLDGTFDKENNENLFKIHSAGIPYKLQIKWKIWKSEYIAYFFFVQESIETFYEKFYGAHPDTKTDFTIRIDPIEKKYELSLYRYGLHSPVVINDDCYELIVFKSGFENFKSTNFSQENGAWIW